MSAPLFECRNLTVLRGSRIALDGVDLTIRAGEHLAILGPNGCGKSTLIRTMTRELYPYLGRGPFMLRIMGRDLWDVASLRAMLGIVTHDLVAACTRGMSSDGDTPARAVTGRETVLSGYFSSVGIWAHHQVTPEMECRADEVLDRLQVRHLADRPLNEVSSGEAHRIVIARALAHNPQALVLDEPTNSLDIRATIELRETVRRIAQAGTTVVLVTHHLPDIVPEIERVVVLERGRVAADGPKATVLTSGLLSGLFALPLRVTERDGYYRVDRDDR